MFQRLRRHTCGRNWARAGRAMLCSPGAAGRGDRLVIGATCPYVRLVPGVCDYITGDRHRPDPVWETAGISPLPRPRPLMGVPFSLLSALWRFV